MKKFFALMCLFVIGAAALTSCEKDKNEPYANHPILGTWYNEETLTSTNTPGFQETLSRTLVFNADGNCTFEFTSQATGLPKEDHLLKGTFDVNSNNITISFWENGEKISETNLYKIEGSKLTISNSTNSSKNITYNRVK